MCFLFFFYVGIVGFFPDTAYYYGSALLVPGSIAVILLAIRGSFYAFENYGSKENSVYLFLYGATGLLIPASLSVALTLSEGGFIVEEGGAVTLEYLKLISSPLSWIIVALAIVSVLFISSAFLTFYASRADDQPALKLVRTYALFWGTPTIIAALTAFIYLSQHNERHFQNMMDLWWLLALSVGFFMIAMWLLYTGRRYGLAFICVMLQFFSAFFCLWHRAVSLYSGPVHYHSERGYARVNGHCACHCLYRRPLLLIPSLILVFKLFLFDADYVKGKK